MDKENTVVYKWVREDGTPYYIGIGNPKRPYTGRRNCGCPPPKDRIIILHENLDWEKACGIEKELIAFYGRKDLGTGILRNLTDGGEGVPNLSKETKNRISMANFGKIRTKEAREKMSKAQLGKKLSEETKRKLSEKNKGRKHTEETKNKFSGKNHPRYGKKHTEESKAKMSKANSGVNHPGYGKSLSKETREKISNSHKGKKLSEETKKKLSKACSGENHPRHTPVDWCHPEYGEVLQKSASDIVKMFPNQKLSRTHLREVARGERFQHKGWIALKA